MRRLALSLACALLAMAGLISGISLAFFGGGGTPGPGDYPVELNLVSDTCGHDIYIFPRPPHQPPPHNMTLHASLVGQMLTVTGPPPWVTVAGTIDNANDFTAVGVNTVAGHQNIHVTFIGNIAQFDLTGSYAFGSNSDLPECMVNGHLEAHPAVYQVKPKPVTATPTSPPTETQPPIPTIPQANGSCTQVQLDVPIGNLNYDEWQCNENDINANFNRVDIGIRYYGGGIFNPIFRCQAGLGTQQVTGSFKRVLEGANPGDSNNPDDYIWSGEFPDACTEGSATVFVAATTTSDPHVPIKRVSFTTVSIPTATATAPQAPTPTIPPENGTCVAVGFDIPISNLNYDEWQCSENDINANFNRVDIGIRYYGGGIFNPIFRCQAGLGTQQVTGSFKRVLEGANPGDIDNPDDYIWSGEFPDACTEGGATVFVAATTTSDPHVPIKRVSFTTVSPTATATPCTVAVAGQVSCPGPTATATRTPPPGPLFTATPTRTATPPPGPLATATATRPAGPLPTATPADRHGNGDVNKDGRVTSVDAALVLQHTAGLYQLNAAGLSNADVNQDGRVDSRDAAVLLQYNADLLDRLPWP